MSEGKNHSCIFSMDNIVWELASTSRSRRIFEYDITYERIFGLLNDNLMPHNFIFPSIKLKQKDCVVDNELYQARFIASILCQE